MKEAQNNTPNCSITISPSIGITWIGTNLRLEKAFSNQYLRWHKQVASELPGSSGNSLKTNQLQTY